ncbi:hypothetical protein GQ44DRAFT_768673 [Phaeosphaeriaceae sp. PMI808]|nr:hypothetical protein GQ44DRAFT_768673 [Phaeosphaeriaceae sp. PMI808]
MKQHKQEQRSMINEFLRECQREQYHQPNSPPMYHYGIFDRYRFMMPERHRLATDLFQTSALRSPLGISVLRDMMSLLGKTSEINCRPGLEPEKCHCQGARNEPKKLGSQYD